MRDYLLELAQDRRAHKVARALGLSLPLPVALRRDDKPWRTQVLERRTVAIGGVEDGRLAQPLASALAEAGAIAWVVGSERAAQAYRNISGANDSGAWVEPVSVLPPVAPNGDNAADALLFDATGITTSDGLRAVYDFFHIWLAHLAPAGRILLVARPPEECQPAQAAAQSALLGFCRSLAKEVGRGGVTVNLVQVASGAEQRLAAAVRFLLSDYSAFTTAQCLSIAATVRANSSTGHERCLAGKVALITGAAGDVGAKISQTLAREGAHVLCLDRTEESTALERVARSVGGVALPSDVADPSTPGMVVQYLRKQQLGIDILVHNASIVRDKTLGSMKGDAWDAVLRTNLSAAVRLTLSLIDEELLHDDGRILAISAVAAIAGNAGQTNYATSLAGFTGLVTSVAPSLAPRGVTANVIAPGLIETDLVATMPAALRQFARRMSALAQGGQPQDVAEAALFLASPGADGVSGRVLRVCGGAFAGV